VATSTELWHFALLVLVGSQSVATTADHRSRIGLRIHHKGIVNAT
jgi:hypothetical protein